MKIQRSAAITSTLALAAVTWACQPSSSGSDVTLESAQERGSYAQGVQIGRQGASYPFDRDAFIQGIRDGLAGESRLDDEEIQQARTDFQGFVSEERKAEAEENRKAGEEFLAENREREEVQVTESGLQYEVIEEGDGPRPESGDRVRVHYRGTTIDGEVFDESYSRGEPATFGVGQVIPGWTEGLQLMQEGAKYKFYIPSDLAYGEQSPRGASFGAGSTLIFEVELLEVMDQASGSPGG